MGQLVSVCVRGLIGGATVCTSVPVWAAVATTFFVASTSNYLLKKK